MQTLTLRGFRRAAVLATTLLIATAATVSADGIVADGDVINTPDVPEVTVPLGKVGPGAVLNVDVGFSLECKNGNHVDRGQTVTLTPIITWQADAFATATLATIGPVPTTWPLDGNSNCTGIAPLAAMSHVSLTAPTTAGIWEYSILYVRSFAPNPVDSTGTSLFTGVTYTLEVVTNTPPSLVLPADMTVEGDTTGGAFAAYTATATDAQDNPPPVPTCSPAPGEVLLLGPTKVTCDVTDSGGKSDEGSFWITVEDTTPPTLADIPEPITVATANAGGTVVDFEDPSADDIVDDSPSVGCLPVAGSVFAIGTTSVVCTATDHEGNSSQASFDVTVRHVDARWGEPIGDGREVSGSAGRTVPVKVTIAVDGVAARSGAPKLRVTACGGGAVERWESLTWSSDRWSINLDTTGLAVGCHRAGLVVGGLEVDAFTLNLGKAEPAGAGKKSPKG